jgi:D-lyxose ketol-isomerase
MLFFDKHQFYLPVWIKWTPGEWSEKGNECDEIRKNQLGWDVTDFAKGDFLKEGLTLVTIRNGNVKRDNKTYCEKIMMVRENQITPIHFHWKKMEDIINRGGGVLCMKLWKATQDEKLSQEPFHIQIDGIRTEINPGEVIRFYPGQSISFEPYIYHTFWAEGEACLVGEVSTVNDDVNDNRFLEKLGRFSEIEEDEAAEFRLCNE